MAGAGRAPTLLALLVYAACGGSTSVGPHPDAALADAASAAVEAAAAVPDAAAPGGGADAGQDAPPDFCQGYVENSGEFPDKPAAAFCDEYAVVCGFGGAGRYLDRNDCLALYLAAPPASQSCRAAHLCYAKTGSAADHCPHAAGMTSVVRCRGT